MNLAVTVALLPALFTGHAERPATTVVRTASAASVPIVATHLPSTTTTTVAPPPPPPPTTTTTHVHAAPKPTTHVHVAPKPAPKPTTTTTVPPPRPAGNTESGKASWYDHQPGVCAHKSLPFGTVVTVTNVANGKRVACTVGDRGPFVEGWVIDLNPREFEQLAPRSAGVISVRLDW